jgi:hypothetical protein
MAAYWAEVEEDGRTVRLELPEVVVRLWQLTPHSRLWYTIRPDGEIVLTVHGTMRTMVENTMEALLPEEGPTADQLVSVARSARTLLPKADQEP